MAAIDSLHLSTSDQREPLAQLGVGPPYGFAVGGEGLHQTLVNKTGD